MSSQSSGIGDPLRSHRLVAGWSQEQLADEAGVSVSVVRKLEKGGRARVEPLRRLARALGVTTAQLFAAGAPAPVVGDESTRQALMSLRQVLMPPVGVEKTLIDPGEAGVATDLWQQIDDGQALYHADRYESVSRMLPDLLRAAEAAVSVAEDELERHEAAAMRSRALLLSGKYLTQVRQYDMAYHALAEGIRVARDIDDKAGAATGVVGMCWLLLRQDRFDDAEKLATVTASQVEPRFSSASAGELALWGELSLRIAAAAVRNNRPDVSSDARRMAATAASALNQEHTDYRQHWSRFGPVTAELKAVEDLGLAEDYRGVLRRADDGILASRALEEFGTPSSINWNRHRLDVAQAHVRLGSTQDAMDELSRIKRTAGNWIKHQPMARDIMEDVLKGRKRSLTMEMRSMAAHIGVHS
ncbi:helix-turn-helix domain-containing protein [Streptomyces sp. NBC_00690]|uniref:helix-turn-helix domain-containing protein n=1 Tax=Streptomyces sp. NBC_00690 TaxID=2975808 RepID=UPI002E29ED9D|nr:helix-turn-helix transcriptional regulator [Streptomyces sp. NBC_00690]